jgi:hypothetical protein
VESGQLRQNLIQLVILVSMRQWTMGKKSKSSSAQSHFDAAETSGLQTSWRGSRINQYHGVPQVNDPHEPRFGAVCTGKDATRPENTEHLGEEPVLQDGGS